MREFDTYKYRFWNILFWVEGGIPLSEIHLPRPQGIWSSYENEVTIFFVFEQKDKEPLYAKILNNLSVYQWPPVLV